MDLKKLSYFLAIAEEGQITRAAQRLHIAQPPLSQQLKQLEKELDTELVERRGSRKINLTASGRLLEERARQILNLVEQTEAELKEMEDSPRGSISIGFVSHIGSSLLLNQVDPFVKRYPKADFRIWEGESSEMLEMLNQGRIDVAIVRNPHNEQRYGTISIDTQPFFGMATVEWADKVSPKDTISLNELAEYPLILHYKSEAIFEYYQQVGMQPNIFCRSNNLRAVQEWAEAGKGIAILPGAMRESQKDHMKIWQIEDPVIQSYDGAILWLKSKPLSPALRYLLQLLKKAVKPE